MDKRKAYKPKENFSGKRHAMSADEQKNQCRHTPATKNIGFKKKLNAGLFGRKRQRVRTI